MVRKQNLDKCQEIIKAELKKRESEIKELIDAGDIDLHQLCGMAQAQDCDSSICAKCITGRIVFPYISQWN